MPGNQARKSRRWNLSAARATRATRDHAEHGEVHDVDYAVEDREYDLGTRGVAAPAVTNAAAALSAQLGYAPAVATPTPQPHARARV